ncbi:MAG: VWA domain-containing protein [Phyllobacteriaceae bacterium]|nr:VWA domain-containing protein [Phyllobacteriaceae bacterium]
MPGKTLASRFLRDTNGSYAVLFAIALVPVILSAGIAVDYASMTRNRAFLQNAMDAAVIAAGAETNMTPEERIEEAVNVFEANVESHSLQVTPQITVDGETISGTANYDYPTSFGGIIGINSIGVSVAAQVKYAVESAAEVAMVLDYSGSMSWNGKWQAMRDAAKDLVDILGENGEREDISFALAPFTNIVRTSMPSQYIKDQPAGSTWTGCTQDRKWPFNIKDMTPVGSNASKWGWMASANNGHCNGHIARNLNIRPLDNDHAAVKAQLDSMSPDGMTHISLGLEFGWHLISPNEPFSQGVAYDTPGTKKFIVLLTDGAQTTKAWGSGNSYTVANGEENLENLCQAIKDKDVYVITVAFDLDDVPTKNRLRDCASNPGYFFEAESNEQLAQAFTTVAALIKGSLHLSQ